MSRRRSTPAWLLLVTLALVALNLRAVLTAIPPLTLDIQQETGWNDTTIGLLTTLPVVVMGLAALIVPWLAQRIGRPQTVWLALALLVVASGGRLAAGIPAVLFVTAFLGGLGIALASGLVPALVREKLPRSTGSATGLWTASMFTGAALAAALTVPIALATGSWQWGLAVWAIPALIALAIWTFVETPYRRHATDRAGGPGAGWREFVGDPGAHPPVAEHLSALVLEERRIGVPGGRQGPCRRDARRIGDRPDRHVTPPATKSSDLRSDSPATSSADRRRLRTNRSASASVCIVERVQDSVLAHGAMNTPPLCCTR